MVNLFWIAVIIICLIVSGIYLLQKNYDVAFVVGVLGILAWFIRLRYQVKKRLSELDQSMRDDPANEDEELSKDQL
jgi:pilus assembly protein TadC